MKTRITAATGAAAAAALCAVVLAGCGTTDAEANEALARAEASARPTPEPTMTLRPCPGGEIMRIDPAGGFVSIKPDCFDQAVGEAIAEFPEPLPAGMEWRIDLSNFNDPAMREQGEISIEDGVQNTMVAGYWLCAWMDSYLHSLDNADGAGQEQAMEYLAKYTSLPSTQEFMVNPEVFDASVIAPAKAGDPAKLREYFKGSCSSFLRSADSPVSMAG